MDGHLAKFWLALALVFLTALGGKVLEADFDWESEVPAAWLQFAAALAALCITGYFAHHAKRTADAQERRADNVAKEMREERIRERLEILTAANWLIDLAVADTTHTEARAVDDDANGCANSWRALAHGFETYGEAVDVLIGRARQGHILLVLTRLRVMLRIKEFGEKLRPEADMAALCRGLRRELEKVRKHLFMAMEMVRGGMGDP